jgi:hypothetical protein
MLRDDEYIFFERCIFLNLFCGESIPTRGMRSFKMALDKQINEKHWSSFDLLIRCLELWKKTSPQYTSSHV